MNTINKKELLMLDMDGCLCDLAKAVTKLSPDLVLGEGDDFEARSKRLFEVCIANPRIFRDLEPMEGAIEAVKQLMEHYDVHFLSTPMEEIFESYTDKRIWLDRHFGKDASKKLILTHRKDLVYGDFLVDDFIKNSVGFKGRFFHFGSEKYPNWSVMLNWFLDRIY